MATEIVSQNADPNLSCKPSTNDDAALLQALNDKCYRKQAIWFLNAFWSSGVNFSTNPKEAEMVWQFVKECERLDTKGEEGKELDEFNAHRVLEKFGEALTVREMRDVLRGMDLDFNKKVTLTEFLVWKYKADWRKLVHAPQGGVDQEKIDLAESKVESAKHGIEQCKLVASEARKSEAEAKSSEKSAVEGEEKATLAEQLAVAAELEAKKAEEESKAAEDIAKASEVAAVENEQDAVKQENLAKESEAQAIKAAENQKAIEDELKSALEELNKEEELFAQTIKDLESVSLDPSKGIVAKGKAANELAQLKTTDPLPLQKAKISQGAVVRRQAKATQSAAATAAAAKSAKELAEQSRVEAVKSREIAVSNREDSEARLSEATSKRKAAEMTLAEQVASKRQAEQQREDATTTRKVAVVKAAEAEAALTAAVESYQSALTYLEKAKEEVKGAGQGKLWFMDRELEDSKKYLSQKQLALLEANSS